MSSFGSSLINKSGRRIAPRAVIRRKQPQNEAPESSVGAASIVANVAQSIEPIATGDEVLQAQIDAQIRQDNEASERLRSKDDGAPSRISTTNADLANVVQDAANANEFDTAAHRHKRARVAGPYLEEQDQSAASLFLPSSSSDPAQSVARPSNPRLTRSRTANTAALTTLESSQQHERVDLQSDLRSGRVIGASNVIADADASQSYADATPDQPIDDANWVVTTQDQIRQKTDATKRRQAQRQHINNEAGGPSSGSSRLANLQKRKKKKEALQKLMNDPVARRDGQSQSRPGEDDGGVNDSEPAEVDNHPDSQQRDVTNETTDVEHPETRKPRRRADTPEEMENVTIVDSLVTMAELSTRERKYGKKSDRERKMRLIDWALVKARRREEEIRWATERGRHRNTAASNADDDEDEGDLENEDDLDAALSRVAARNRARRRGTGIRIRVVNGEHVIDEQSQRVDRHALANEDLDALEEVEEEELTQRFNSQTYINMKRRDPADRLPINDRWTSASTDKFYDCLRRFGTDFMIISKMFPGRTRRQIKAKFVREEKSDLKRVHDALYSGLQTTNGEDELRETWDIDVFRENAGIDLSQLLDPREVERELESVRKLRELAIEERRKETEEMKRQRRLAGEVSSDEEEGQEQKLVEQTKEVVPNKHLADDELEEVEEFE